MDPEPIRSDAASRPPSDVTSPNRSGARVVINKECSQIYHVGQSITTLNKTSVATTR